MKALLSLVVFSFTLAFCHGACFNTLPKTEMIDGVFVEPDGCVDVYDKTKHPLRSVWHTAECMRCSCDHQGNMECCARYGGIAHVLGCEAVVDPETCRYTLHEPGDPSKPCALSKIKMMF